MKLFLALLITIITAFACHLTVIASETPAKDTFITLRVTTVRGFFSTYSRPNTDSLLVINERLGIDRGNDVNGIIRFTGINDSTNDWYIVYDGELMKELRHVDKDGQPLADGNGDNAWVSFLKFQSTTKDITINLRRDNGGNWYGILIYSDTAVGTLDQYVPDPQTVDSTPTSPDQ